MLYIVAEKKTTQFFKDLGEQDRVIFKGLPVASESVLLAHPR